MGAVSYTVVSAPARALSKDAHVHSLRCVQASIVGAPGKHLNQQTPAKTNGATSAKKFARLLTSDAAQKRTVPEIRKSSFDTHAPRVAAMNQKPNTPDCDRIIRRSCSRSYSF
jgi:hypothetical protein